MALTAAAPSYLERLALYHAGRVGGSVRMARLCSASLRQLYACLRSLGFHSVPDAIVVARTSEGAPRWLRMDGTSTVDRSDHQLLPAECHVHLDGGMVRVLPVGDPRGRLALPGRPFAIKSVLFEPPTFAHGGQLQVDTSFRNEAFRLTDEGEPIPKSRRAVYGMRSDARSGERSYLLAQRVYGLGVLVLRGPA